MKQRSIILGTVMSALLLSALGAAALAQVIPPGGSQFNPPPPPPPPPPRIAPAVIPQMDAPVSRNYAPAPRPSFGDRIRTCLDEAAASGLGPSERSAYSRSCANR